MSLNCGVQRETPGNQLAISEFLPLTLGRFKIMSIFSPQSNLVPIHADNAKTRDWLILLEAATIVGKERHKLRVALTTQERKMVKRRKLFGKTEHFVVVDGYDPRIHALYFCPQLYRNDGGALVPLTGEEIGQLMAQALERGAIEKPPWYEPCDNLPKEPVIKATPEMEFDSLVVDAPASKAKSTALRAVPITDRETRP
jgi:hypothetical protein